MKLLFDINELLRFSAPCLGRGLSFIEGRFMDGSFKKGRFMDDCACVSIEVSGFIRESIVAKEFGASAETDAYFLAFGFITLVVAMISTGLITYFCQCM